MKKEQICRYVYWAGLAGIFAVFCVTRLWKLAGLPYGIHIDEAGMGYDAWCLAHYGVDRYLKSWPVYLVNYGGGQSALYAYLCAALFKVSGYSVIAMRLPAVLGSFLNLVFGMKLARKVFQGSRCLELVTGTAIAVCPYFIMAGRFGLDCNLMLGFSTMFLFLFWKALEKGGNRDYVLAGLAGGILLYTYAICYLVLIVFLLISLCCVVRAGKFRIGKWLLMGLPLGILALPLILVQCVNLFGWEEFRLGIFTVTKLPIYRESEIGPMRIGQLFQAYRSVFYWDDLPYNSVAGYPNLYTVTRVLFPLGICSALARLIRDLVKRKISPGSIPLFWFLSLFGFGGHILANTNKMNGIFLAALLLAIEGVCVLGRVFKKGRLLAAGAVLGCYLLGFGRFAGYYYGGQYTADTYLLPYFDIDISEGTRYIEEREDLKRKPTYMAEHGIYYALGMRPDPGRLTIEAEKRTDPYVEKDRYIFGSLGTIEDGYNYLVRDGFDSYCDELRAAGFQEVRFQGYSLYYKAGDS